MWGVSRCDVDDCRRLHMKWRDFKALYAINPTRYELGYGYIRVRNDFGYSYWILFGPLRTLWLLPIMWRRWRYESNKESVESLEAILKIARKDLDVMEQEAMGQIKRGIETTFKIREHM